MVFILPLSACDLLYNNLEIVQQGKSKMKNLNLMLSAISKKTRLSNSSGDDHNE